MLSQGLGLHGSSICFQMAKWKKAPAEFFASGSRVRSLLAAMILPVANDPKLCKMPATKKLSATFTARWMRPDMRSGFSTELPFQSLYI